MLWTKLFIPTLREAPSDGNAAQRLLTRAGYTRASGFLPLGKRSIDRLANMVREEMEAVAGQEVSLPTPFAGSFAEIARHDLRSYKQLPQVWFQIEGSLHESCSVALDHSANLDAFRRILDRCGVHYIALDDEIVALSPDGDQIITRGSQYEANLKRARAVPKPPVTEDPEGDLSPEEFHTPAKKTIADVSAFTGLPETSQMKSLVMVVDDAPVLILLRGDHTLNEHKLHASAARQATPDEIRRWFHADAGSLGPIGVTGLRIIADDALRGRRNMICGANRNDYHLRRVTPGEDFQAEFLDLRLVVEGDTSLIDATPLRFEPAFTLASTRDIEADLHVSNESGKEIAPRLTHHQLFLDRILIAAAEQQHDKDGLTIAPAIAPFGVVITPVNLKDQSQHQAAHDLHAEFTSAGFDPLLDDRDERPGVKFKDADLIGIPFRVTLGKKLAQGLAEVMDRRSHESQDVALDRVSVFLSDKGCNES